MTAISSPGGDGVSTRSRAIRAPPPLSLDEQQSIERQVRTAALAAARNNIAPGELDRIVSLATDDFTLGAPGRSMADRINLAVSLAEAVEKTHAPFNWLSATPQQIEAYRAAMGLLGHHHLAGLANLASAGASGGSSATGVSGETPAATSTAYDHALNSSERSVFNSLAKQYGAGAANGALGFARELGTTPDMARKLIRLDQNERHDLKGFIDEVRNLPPEEQKKRAEEWSKKHKGKLSPSDILRIIRDRSDKQMKQKGPQEGVHDEAHKERTADLRNAGIDKSVEAQHKHDVTAAHSSPASAQRDDDVLAAALATKEDKKPKAAGAKPKGNAVVSKADSNRHAGNPKAATPAA